MGRYKYNIKYFKNLAIERGGLCLSNNYINSHSKLKFQCDKGHIWKTKPYYLTNNGSWCPKCQKNHKDNIETYHKIAKKRGGECLSNEYVNSKSKLKFQCDKGHIWESIANDIKYLKVWCPYCSNNKKLTIEKMQEIASERGGECLSNEYINSHSKLKWKCEKGHIWEAKPYLVKNSNNWCPICNESLGERKLSFILKNMSINFIREMKFENCKNKHRLPFDFYLPDYKILIEYDGKQHFEIVNFYGSSIEKAKKNFIKIKNNDKIKNEYCKTNNIPLIRISYKIKNIEKYLQESLSKLI